MDKLKILELFGGIGACSKAIENLGIDYEIVDYVEIDKYATKSFNAIHGTNFEPQDITTWDKNTDLSSNKPINNLRIRRLTPKECWRLMGFSNKNENGVWDDSTFEKAEKVNSNTQLYKQAGNSIVVQCLENIIKELIMGNENENKDEL